MGDQKPSSPRKTVEAGTGMGAGSAALHGLQSAANKDTVGQKCIECVSEKGDERMLWRIDGFFTSASQRTMVIEMQRRDRNSL